jgi:hypothetical protein
MSQADYLLSDLRFQISPDKYVGIQAGSDFNSGKTAGKSVNYGLLIFRVRTYLKGGRK